jgi:transposase
VLPRLLLSRKDSRRHSLRELFNGVRYIVRTGNQWRYMPSDLPPWPAVYQQMRRWMDARVFEILVADVQELLRHFEGRKSRPTAVCMDSRTLQSTPESGARAGYEPPHERRPVRGDPGDGARRSKGSRVHIAVDTLAGRRGAAGHRIDGCTCVCGPGLHRRKRSRSRSGARHTP